MAGGTLFRATFLLGGCIALGAGLHSLLAGARAIPGRRGPAEAGIESELRFYSAFYVAYGFALLRLGGRAEREPALTRALVAPLFLAGLGRLAAWRAAGAPSRNQQALLAAELGIPPIVLGWRAALAARYPGGEPVAAASVD